MPGNKKSRKLLVLLDSHAIIHRAYHALPDFASSKGKPTGALYGVSTMLFSIIEKYKPEYIVACYDLPDPTHRHQVYDNYKSGRKKTDDALIEQLISSREIFEACGIPIYDMPGFEADDILGTIVEKITHEKGFENIDVLIASGDMDTLQLIEGDRVKVFTLKKGIKDTVVYNEKAVFERFGFGPKQLPDYKGLRGDPSDNIIGISGIGEKTATTLITSFGSVEGIYEALEKDPNIIKGAGISDRIIELLDKGKEEALFSKMLATIRRDAPISFELPKHLFREDFNSEKIENLFRELEFRSLIPKVKNLISNVNGQNSVGEFTNQNNNEDDNRNKETNKKNKKIQKNNDDVGESINNNLSKQKGSLFEEKIYGEIDWLTEQKLKVAVYVLNSNITNPGLDDVFAITRTKDPVEAEKVLITEIEHAGLGKVLMEIEWPLIEVCKVMTENGVKIDIDFMKTLSRDYHKKISDLEKKIWSISGTEFNVSSPKQLGEVLFDKMGLGGKKIKKTSTGARSTKESELEKMRGEHEIIDMIFEYRELSKLVGTYIDVLPSLVDDKNRIHATFMQTGTTTGRMSSQDPNLQNIPIKSEQGRAIRKAFISEDGYTLLAFDYSQIELRIAAFLSGDQKLIEIFKNGVDVHAGVASQVFKVDIKDVTKDMRRKAKVINFGILYGMGVNALKANLGSTKDEASAFYNEYFKTFSGLAEYLEKVKQDTAKKGYTETFFGRRRYFEGINSRLPFIKAAAERMAINAPIQGTQADIIKISMRRIHDKLAQENMLNKARLVLQIHDELIYEVRTPEIKKVSKIIKDTMESVLRESQTMGVPIKTSANQGKNWGEMEEIDLS